LKLEFALESTKIKGSLAFLVLSSVLFYSQLNYAQVKYPNVLHLTTAVKKFFVFKKESSTNMLDLGALVDVLLINSATKSEIHKIYMVNLGAYIF
jgi:hypothetical protein